jgi:serine/threonine protein kinase
VSGSISREEFEKNLGESGLLSEVSLRELLGGLASERDINDGDTLARRLVHLGHLTPFQADAVRGRRFEEVCVGNYIILEHLGSGGMGTVYKARHRRMKRFVALKVLHREAAGRGSFAQRFEREVETIAQLSHPNIVMAFDADEAEVGPFLVMEYVDGRDLSVEVGRGGPLSIAESVEATLQAARGLEYAHGRGFIHRDVKPANLLRDSRSQVKVADLGLARLKDVSADQLAVSTAGNVVGTAEYMSPEQALDSSTIDHRSDIYALGCTLFYLLTGRAPYAASSLMGLLLKHRDAPIPSLRQACPVAPAQLDVIFQRMAAKSPDDRHASMAELIVELERVSGLTATLNVRPARVTGDVESSGLGATVSVDASRPPSPPTTIHGDAASRPDDQADSSMIRRVSDLVVVMVEPSRAQAGIVRRYLHELGVEQIFSANTGGEAIELTRREGAHVLFSAMHLADMTGAELAHTLLDDPDCAGVGIVLASSEPEGTRSIEHEIGPRMALLTKPFDLRALSDSLAHVTGRVPEKSLRSPD